LTTYNYKELDGVKVNGNIVTKKGGRK